MLKMLRVSLPQPGQLTVPQPTTDVTEWETLRSPDDDIHGALMAELGRALQVDPPPALFSSQYGFTDADVALAFGQLARNPATRLLFDKTQAAGTHESPILAGLKATVRPEQFAVGTSPVHSQILHTKAVALLYADGTGWVMTGSFNLSASARQQFNIVDLVRSRSRSVLFAGWITEMFNWVKANEGVKA